MIVEFPEFMLIESIAFPYSFKPHIGRNVHINAKDLSRAYQGSQLAKDVCMSQAVYYPTLLPAPKQGRQHSHTKHFSFVLD